MIRLIIGLFLIVLLYMIFCREKRERFGKKFNVKNSVYFERPKINTGIDAGIYGKDIGYMTRQYQDLVLSTEEDITGPVGYATTPYLNDLSDKVTAYSLTKSPNSFSVQFN